MSRIKVMLVEDDEFWQRNLSQDLNREEDIEVVKIVSSKEEALEAALTLDIDVILMDINLTANQLDGLEATKEIFKEHKANVKIVMLTSLSDRDIIIKSFQNGAVNYITKSSYQDIVQAVRDANDNHASIHSDAAMAMRSEIQLMTLTPMEREVYELREKGLNKTQISETLHKSVNTIKTQMKSIKNKLMR